MVHVTHCAFGHCGRKATNYDPNIIGGYRCDEHEDADEVVECRRCNGTGEIGRSSRTGSYIGPGPVPEDARGVCSATCDECRGTGYVEINA